MTSFADMRPLYLKAHIAMLEAREAELAAELRKAEAKRVRELNQARKRLRSRVRSLAAPDRYRTGLRDGTASDVLWTDLQRGRANNVGWLVNHAGLRICRGSAGSGASASKRARHESAAETNGDFYGAGTTDDQ